MTVFKAFSGLVILISGFFTVAGAQNLERDKGHLSKKVDTCQHIDIVNIFMPTLPKVSRTVAIYFQLINRCKNSIMLQDVSTKVAKYAMIHRSFVVDGVVKMRHAENLVIGAETQFDFAIGGTHLMLMGVNHELLSAPFEVTLKFSNQVSKTFLVNPQQGTH